MGSIDCYITNRDLLTAPMAMVNDLKRAQSVGRITIVDCASTYTPLLNWYESLDDVEVIHSENLGPRAPWKHRRRDTEFYFVTDGDLDISGVPSDFLEVLRHGLVEHPDRIKAGLSLEISDLPPDRPLTAGVVDMEKQYWLNRMGTWFDANIDTTAAVYRNDQDWGGYGPALRADRPYVARHLAWYLDPGKMPDDWKYYLDHLDPRGILWSPRLKTCLS